MEEEEEKKESSIINYPKPIFLEQTEKEEWA